MNQVSDHDLEELTPPSPARVARRALALSMVTCRAFLEPETDNPEEFWNRARCWFTSLLIDDELETYEREMINAPLGKLEPQARINGTWLCEALAVLAWALGRFDLPPYDQEAVAADAAQSIGFLKDTTVLACPQLRSRSDLDSYGDHIWTVHWRLREYSLRPCPIDFEKVAETAWFGPMCLDRIRLVRGDMALEEATIDEAPQPLFRKCLSIAQERHRALNWLAGYGDPLSEVDTST